MFDVTASTILWANNLSSAKDIHPGDTLLILPVSGIEHRVAKGETLATLAKKYGGDAGDIASFNGLDPNAALAVGSNLIIPGGELSGTVATKTAVSTPVKTGGGLTSILRNPYKGGSGAADNGYYGNPVPGGIITQGIHGWNGVDIGAKTGTPIYAAASGKVIVSRTGGWNGGYGNYVVISHANGTQTLYAHMSSVSASIGATVSRGQVIGYVGRTGEATGPHLHYEVRGAANPFRACAIGRACSPQ
jgi:murein DD-endopeptidase MepM/ murein hydrolase activator NlpD